VAYRVLISKEIEANDEEDAASEEMVLAYVRKEGPS